MTFGNGLQARGALKLSLSASILAIAATCGTAAYAQDTEDQAADGPAIVVTGTRIAGTAPVGSAVIPVTREDLAKIGASTTNDALRKIPQIVNFGGSNDQAGGSVIQNSSLNSFYAKSINLRGLGTASTLTLVNGHRVAPQGSSGQLFDADNIPAIALERIEVVADGGSAIYGSDAIAGVVNFLMRRPQDTVEAQFRAGFADSVEEYIGSLALGKAWSTGGFFLSGEYQKRTALETADRPDLYNSDLSAYGAGANPFFSSPANVVIGGVPYGIPTGQDGSGVTLGDLSPNVNRQNQWLGGYGIPSGERYSAVGTFEQELGDSVTFKADGLFSRHEFLMKYGASFATLDVGPGNPYSPCAPGAPDDSATLNCPGNGRLSVPYSFINDLGPQSDTGYEELWSISGGFDVSLTDSWNANLTGYYSENRGNRLTENQVNTGSLVAAINAPTGGLDFFNPFCDGDEFSCNSEATVDSFRAFTELGSRFKTKGVTATVNGSLFELGGGAVKVAVGGEYHKDSLAGTGLIGNTRTPNATIIDPGLPTYNTREVSSGYAELFVPVVGASNATPGIARLELDAAVRYDHYSDVGSTTNPKFGINYAPIEGLTFRGSYSTSFRAPTLVDVDMFATAGFLPRAGSGAAVGLSPANGTFNYIYQVGGNPTLKPETSESWSVGVDLSHELVPNLRASLTYYNLTYTNRIDTPAYNTPVGAALSSAAYADLVVLNPTYFANATMTQAQYNTFINDHVLHNPDGLGVFGPPLPPEAYIAYIDGRRQNGGVVETDGLDFQFDYVIPGDTVSFRLGAQANYILSFKTSPLPGVSLVDEVNHFGYPAQFTGRAEVGVDVGGFSGTAFVNHVGGREITRAYLPVTSPDQYLDIDAYTTVDLTLRYAFEDSESFITDGLALTVSAQNIFDVDPPLVVNTGGTPIPFDPSYSSALGRFVSFTISKKFF